MFRNGNETSDIVGDRRRVDSGNGQRKQREEEAVNKHPDRVIGEELPGGHKVRP